LGVTKSEAAAFCISNMDMHAGAGVAAAAPPHRDQRHARTPQAAHQFKLQIIVLFGDTSLDYLDNTKG
jgi:hypothetical protein